MPMRSSTGRPREGKKSVAELIRYILESFLENDRGFVEAHPNYKRRGLSRTDDQLDFVMHAQDDVEREIHLALLTFAFRTTTNMATA